ncbi:MAG: DUF1592 domain-containing protein [Gemmatimonadetes bacterium]|nr:DUF1592 domain-containing protein [Gemmatimonadota bacterium]
MKNPAVPSFVLGTLLVLTSGGALTEAKLPLADASLAPATVAASGGVHATVEVDADEVVQKTCVGCHNDRRLTGNLSLEAFSLDDAAANAEVGERMIRKLRAGMMPPPGARRPGGDTLLALVETIEGALDEVAARDPNPGSRSFQRLNRAEYERAVEDLLGLKVDAGDWLPLDQMSANFDNIADAQPLSPMLLDAYLNAAATISRLAVGNRNAAANNVAYKIPEYVSQHPWDHVEGAPYGTRGGLVVDHAFPADGEYVFEMSFSSGDNAPFEDIDVSIDGERVALLNFTLRGVGADGRGSASMSTEPVFVRAGQHRLSVAFVRRFDGPYEDLIRPHVWSMAGGGAGGGGITTLPHIRDVIVQGPYNPTGVSETETRRRIFTCRPTVAAEEEPCAREIVRRLATDAYRRPVADGELAGLMDFYHEGAADGFEIGVRAALEAILSSPFFVLRLETEPEDVRPGENYFLSDVDVASRLAFFLWGGPPDDVLLKAATEGDLSDEDELERQARRMLADRRAEALGKRFAAQWLRLQDLYKVRPDPNFYPNLDENLADAMRRETEMLLRHIVAEDRPVLDLLQADYTFLNELLADHYGIPGVVGGRFRKVTYPDDRRRGVLGHGSILTQTSLANRTSPVLRGKWVMEVLMGTPPPPPPPGVPDLEETEGAVEGRQLTTRERMEIHRASPTCNSCHRFMDPIGLALDNFDVTGRWRMRENGVALDTRGDFYDGTPVTSPSELVAALLARPIPLVRTFTENLMAYGVGRRVEYFDQPAIREIVREAEKNDYRMSSLILGVVKSDAFRMKRAVPAAADQQAEDGRP